MHLSGDRNFSLSLWLIFKLGCVFDVVQLQEFFMYAGYELHTRYMICRYFLPLHSLPFHSVERVLFTRKFSILM